MPPARRQVSLTYDDYQKAANLRDTLAEVSGRRVTLTDTIGRALACLEDAHARGAWLSPKEAAPVLERRMRDQLVSVLAQFIARTMPDRAFRGVVYERGTTHASGGMLRVLLGEQQYVPLLLVGEGGAAALPEVES